MYRIFMIGVAVTIGSILWLVMERTRMGAVVRATVDDAEMKYVIVHLHRLLEPELPPQ